MAKIQDVAKLAGVSTATVSRVLNNPESVKNETSRRVMSAIKSLDYTPNRVAKSLSSKAQDITVGVIFPDIATFYFAELYKGMSREARENNINILLHELEEGANAREETLMNALHFLKKSNVSGILLSSRYIPKEYDQAIKRLGIPLVMVLSSHEAGSIPAFKIDDKRAAFDSVAYLVSRGHQRIGIISAITNNHNSGELRHQGFLQGIQYYNLPLSPEQIVYGKMRYDDGYKAMTELLSNHHKTKITAVFAATDEMAIGAIRCVIDSGLKVPEDISIIGYDNLSISDMTIPKLTTISQPFYEIGKESMKHMIEIIKEPDKGQKSGNHFLAYQLVERESVKELT
ncbi:substrate-binding domain-containing protein [Gordoniibacillus kamchatkensis]|uniref:substrate-binding domain-containing protein n=1 Tax=Gordoniibacillus kamchatkensis TaxID=1590651 RepID=UPI000698D5BB|nr:substrate-binding domain-containing protein [Paenibacillus sp. VKM B-2647]